MCVTVIGPPSLICSLNKGNTDPLEPSTFPNLTIVNLVFDPLADNACNINSEKRFETPIILVGRTALSVEINTKVSTPLLTAA